jgi:hypothetical protein
MNSDVSKWLNMSRQELDEVYQSCSAAGTIPQGEMRGTAILAGSSVAKMVAAFAHRKLPIPHPW